MFKDPSGEWTATEKIAEANIIDKMILLHSLDRKQAISLIHNDDAVYNFDRYELKKLLTTVCKKANDLKSRDYRYISARVWKFSYLKSDKKDDKIVNNYLDEWENLFSYKENYDLIEPEKISISDFKEPLKIVWPLLVALEGLQIILFKRYDLSPNINETEYEDLLKFRTTIANAILKNNLINELENVFTEKHSNVQNINNFFGFYILIRKLTLFQQARFTINDSNNYNYLKKEYLKNYEKGIKRYVLATSEPRTYDGLINDNSFILFHEVITRLEFCNYNQDDKTDTTDTCVKPIRDIGNKSLSLSNKLLCLCKVNFSNNNIPANDRYIALQVFANIVYDFNNQFKALRSRRLLIESICASNSNDNNIFILPHPQSIEPKFIKAIDIDESSNFIKSIILISKIESKESFERNIEDLSLTQVNTIKEWKPINIREIKGISCYIADVSGKKLQYAIANTRKINDPVEKLKHIVDIFEQLANKSNHDKYIISPFNIFAEQNNEIFYQILSAKRDNSEVDILRSRGFGAQYYREIQEISIPLQNSILWRIGLAIAGLFDLSKHYSKIDRCKLQIKTEKKDIIKVLNESFLLKTIFILCGSKWWSSKHNTQTTDYPWAIEKALTNAKDFLETKDSDLNTKICLWLSNRYLINLQSTLYENKDKLDTIGGFVYIKFLLSKTIIPNHPLLLEQLKKDMTYSDEEPELSNTPRSLFGLIQLISILRKFNETELADIITIYKIRFIVSFFKMITLFEFKIAYDKVDINIERKVSIKLGIDGKECNYMRDFRDVSISEFIKRLKISLETEPFDTTLFNRITPLGWYVAAITLNSKRYGFDAVNEMGILNVDVVQLIVEEYVIDEEKWPLPKNSNEIDGIVNRAYNTVKAYLGNLKNEFSFKSYESISPPIQPGFEIISSEGSFQIAPWQISCECFPGEDQNRFERKLYKEKRYKYIFSEIWYKGDLVHISLLGDEYAKFVAKSYETTRANIHSKKPEKTIHDEIIFQSAIVFR